ncbi:MAG: DUF86 domain-containing protein [Saprospiraceae bacterium]|nr:DUF86 domain-containing protein [Saprospiraceae bacterium]
MDMLDAIEAVMIYTDNISYEQYLSDRRTRDAIYRNIMVLGEAAARMPESFVKQNPDIEWNKMISTRNALVHGYDKIDDRIVWNIIQTVMPKLKNQIKNLKEKF